MSASKGVADRTTDAVDRRDRKFSVSTNRGKASHRVRYVEVGGAGVDVDQCAFCEATPDLSGARHKNAEEE